MALRIPPLSQRGLRGIRIRARATSPRARRCARRRSGCFRSGTASRCSWSAAVNVHAIAHMKESLAYTVSGAALVITLVTLFQIGGVMIGWVIGDRFEKRLIAAACMLMHCLGLLSLTYATSATMLVIAFAALHGVAWGLRGPFMHAIRADYFGRSAIGMILGLSFMIIVIGQIGGPMIAGLLADMHRELPHGLYRCSPCWPAWDPCFSSLPSGPRRRYARRHEQPGKEIPPAASPTRSRTRIWSWRAQIFIGMAQRIYSAPSAPEQKKPDPKALATLCFRLAEAFDAASRETPKVKAALEAASKAAVKLDEVDISHVFQPAEKK